MYDLKKYLGRTCVIAGYAHVKFHCLVKQARFHCLVKKARLYRLVKQAMLYCLVKQARLHCFILTFCLRL